MPEYDCEVIRLQEAGFSYKDISEKLGITLDQVKHALSRVRRAEGTEERLPNIEKSNDTYMITSGERVISISEAKLRLLKEYYCAAKMTINQVCRKLDIPRRDFNVIRTAFGITKDDSPFLPDDHYTKTVDELAEETLERRKDLYFAKLEQKEIEVMRQELAKYRQEDYRIQQIHTQISEHMKGFAKTYRGPDKRTVAAYAGDGYMLEVAIFDLHIGKLAWVNEVGASYDYKIAKRRFAEVNDDIISRASDRPISKILFVVGSDLFHFDTPFQTTAAGTPQDADLRWHKLYAIGVEMLVTEIDKYALIAPVDVIGVPGNHDKQTVYYAMKYLEAWYRNDPVVSISDNLRTRKYVEFGKNLIGFTHGDKEKKRISHIMQVEMPAAWGRTRFREFHMGHVHHEDTEEKPGVILRNLSTVTGTDAWHYESGYVGTVQKAQSFLWDKDKGLYEIWNTTLGVN